MHSSAKLVRVVHTDDFSPSNNYVIYETSSRTRDVTATSLVFEHDVSESSDDDDVSFVPNKPMLFPVYEGTPPLVDCTWSPFATLSNSVTSATPRNSVTSATLEHEVIAEISNEDCQKRKVKPKVPPKPRHLVARVRELKMEREQVGVRLCVFKVCVSVWFRSIFFRRDSTP